MPTVSRRYFLTTTTMHVPLLAALSMTGLGGCGYVATAARPAFWLLPDAAAPRALLPYMLAIPPRPADVTAATEHPALQAISRLLPALAGLPLPQGARTFALLAVGMDDAARVARSAPTPSNAAAACAAAATTLASALALPLHDSAALADAYTDLPVKPTPAQRDSVDTGWRTGQAVAAVVRKWAAADGADQGNWGRVRPIGGVLLPTAPATPEAAPPAAAAAPVGLQATVQGVLDELEGGTDAAAISTTLASVAVALHACLIAAAAQGDDGRGTAAWPHAVAAVLAAARPDRAAALRAAADASEGAGAALGLAVARATLAAQPAAVPEVPS